MRQEDQGYISKPAATVQKVVLGQDYSTVLLNCKLLVDLRATRCRSVPMPDQLRNALHYKGEKENDEDPVVNSGTQQEYTVAAALAPTVQETEGDTHTSKDETSCSKSKLLNASAVIMVGIALLLSAPKSLTLPVEVNALHMAEC